MAVGGDLMRTFWVYPLLTLSACVATPAVSDSCPYLPAYRELQSALPGMTARQASAALESYAATHDNTEGCEAADLDRRLGEAERELFQLRLQDRRRLPAQAVYRCNEFDPVTAACRSPMEDGTAHPMSAGIAALAPPLAQAFTVVGERNGVKLQSVYIVSLADALDGRPATRMKLQNGCATLPVGAKDVALIAIFKTHGPWRYRKAIWYFLDPAGNAARTL